MAGIKDRLARVPVLGTALRVQERYTADAADSLAASIGFFGFLSLFPLLILALAVTGFLLRDDPVAQRQVVTTITGAIPGFQAILGGADCSVAQAGAGGGAGAAQACTAVAGVVRNVTSNAGSIGLVGLATLLLSGLRVVNGAAVATSRVFRLPLPTGAAAKARQVGVLAGLGLLAAAGVAAGSLPGLTGLPGPVRVLVGPLLSLALDVGLFLVAYRLLGHENPLGWRDLLPGALLAGTGWTALKLFGAGYVAGQIADANALYGALGGVIALLLLLYLAGRLYLYGAELTAHLAGIPLDEVALERDGDGDGGTGEATGPATSAPSGDGTSLARARASDGPPPPPLPRPAADAPSPAVTPATRARVEERDDVRRRGERGPDVRGAVAFAIAAGAVGGLLRLLRPGRRPG
ncbi:MAG: YihY/virulence factor BrkB family protein [Actinomycetes bacterium]